METLRDLTKRGINELSSRMPAHIEWIQNNPKLIVAGYLLSAANLIAEQYNPSLTIPSEGSEWTVVRNLILGVVPGTLSAMLLSTIKEIAREALQGAISCMVP